MSWFQLNTDSTGMVVDHQEKNLPPSSSSAEGESASNQHDSSFDFDAHWKDDDGTDTEPDIPDPVLPPEIIEAIQRNVRQRDGHKMLQATRRNVIILGRTRVGKSTCVDVLKDGTHVPPMPTLFSETKDAQFKSFSLKDDSRKNGSIPTNYTINIVDTPGLFEVNRVSEGEGRDNSFIKKCIRKCLENEIARIHCVLIFLTVEGGINDKDVKAIEIFLEDFASSKVTACLCITHAESFDQRRKDKVVEELQNYPKASKLIDQHKVKILFMGCVDPDKHSDPIALTNAYNKVAKMRKKLLKTIFQADDKGALLASLKAIKQSNESTLMLAKECRNFLVSMTEKQRDMSLAELKPKLKVHSENMSELAKDEAILYRDLAITPVVKDIEKLLKKAARMYDDDTVSKLSSPFSFPGSPKADSTHGQRSSSSSSNGVIKLENKAHMNGKKAAPSFASASSISSFSSSSALSSSSS